MARDSFWVKHILPYFVFSRGERNGIMVLLVLLGLSWFIPVFLPEKKLDLLPEEIRLIDSFQRAHAAAGKERERGNGRYRTSEGNDARGNERYRLSERNGTRVDVAAAGKERRAFTLRKPFDPNTASAGVWETTGLPAHTIRTILRFVDKGGRFRKPEDLQKIYGLSREDYNAIRPYLSIQKGGEDRGRSAGYGPAIAYPERTRRMAVHDINKADSADWESLPGIGPVLARRIMLFRSGLGGFISVDQVGEVHGLPDSVFRRIRSRLTMEESGGPIPLHINQAGADILEKHPYISRKLAALIVAYRKQHGPYNRAEDLMALPLVTPELLKQLGPYLSFN